MSLPQLAKEYALPALGLLVAASFVGPLVGGLVMTALGLGAALAFGAGVMRARIGKGVEHAWHPVAPGLARILGLAQHMPASSCDGHAHIRNWSTCC